MYADGKQNLIPIERVEKTMPIRLTPKAWVLSFLANSKVKGNQSRSYLRYENGPRAGKNGHIPCVA